MRKLSAGFSTLNMILVILAVLLVAAAGSFGVYEWQHNKVNDLNSKLSSLNSRVANLNNQVAALSNQLNIACKPSGSAVCNKYTYYSVGGVSLLIFTPLRNETITNPVEVVGEVPGDWSFEAQFPVLLKDSTGAIIFHSTAHVIGNWMTSQLVPFSAELSYTGSRTGSGTIVIQKDNPSGLAKNTDSLSIPIRF